MSVPLTPNCSTLLKGFQYVNVHRDFVNESLGFDYRKGSGTLLVTERSSRFRLI